MPNLKGSINGPTARSSEPVSKNSGLTGVFNGTGEQHTFRGNTNGGWAWNVIHFNPSKFFDNWSDESEKLHPDYYTIETWMKYK